MKKILVVDDEKSIVKGIKFSLEQDDMKVEVAYDGETALELAKANHYDMILLDIMLPGFSGLEVCQMIREFSDVPIIMLTAKGDDMDKILGLEYGADDYITKPFNILEVKARIKAIFRRNNRNVPEQENQKVIETKGLKIDVDSRRVYIDDKEVNLTAKEFELVYLLVSNPNKVYSREQLLKTIWGPVVYESTTEISYSWSRRIGKRCGLPETKIHSYKMGRGILFPRVICTQRKKFAMAEDTVIDA